MIKETVVKEFYARESGPYRMVMRVVSWGKGGLKLEKRQQYNSDGEWRNGKAKGLDYSDIKLILDSKDELLDLMKPEDKF